MKAEELAAALVAEYSGDELIESIAIELRSAREEGRPRWQAIDTAPRDGTHFLTWDAHYGIRIGRCLVRADHDDWLSYVGSHGDSSKGGMRATHWMPLPTPPGDELMKEIEG